MKILRSVTHNQIHYRLLFELRGYIDTICNTCSNLSFVKNLQNEPLVEVRKTYGVKYPRRPWLTILKGILSVEFSKGETMPFTIRIGFPPIYFDNFSSNGSSVWLYAAAAANNMHIKPYSICCS